MVYILDSETESNNGENLNKYLPSQRIKSVCILSKSSVVVELKLSKLSDVWTDIFKM